MLALPALSSRPRVTSATSRTRTGTAPRVATAISSISTKLLQELGGATVIGPILVGLDRAVQIVPLSANDSQLGNMAALGAFMASG